MAGSSGAVPRQPASQPANGTLCHARRSHALVVAEPMPRCGGSGRVGAELGGQAGISQRAQSRSMGARVSNARERLVSSFLRGALPQIRPCNARSLSIHCIVTSNISLSLSQPALQHSLKFTTTHSLDSLISTRKISHTKTRQHSLIHSQTLFSSRQNAFHHCIPRRRHGSHGLCTGVLHHVYASR